MRTVKIARADGRTNAEVVMALVQAHQHGDLLTYEALRAALAPGTDREWTVSAVQSAVRGAMRRIGREARRALMPVAGQGYRIAHAHEHTELARRGERKGHKAIRRAVETLQHVDWKGLTPAQRTLHEAHLAVTGALCGQMDAVLRKQKKHEDAIGALLSRVERLETRPGV